ncbi:MAG: Smr/MutS family protein [Altererythrobacter sp.]
MSHPRGLSEDEAALWEKVAATVTPMHPARKANRVAPRTLAASSGTQSRPVMPAREPDFDELIERGVGRTPRTMPSAPRPSVASRKSDPLPQHGLDSHWDRKLKSGQVDPDFSLDLHGHSLDAAWHRLDSGLFQAKAMGARLVLLVTGRPRPVDAADRANKRGAIRAKILDWLAAGPHGSDIAAIRKAHRRHGGEGALYLVLKRR